MAGEMAEILGPSLTVDDQADACGTIGYEILTALRVGRYQRRYIDEPAPGAAPI
jgi:alanine racemase